mmetsp:Transcript_85346/g.260973  ORF Transcript_85346/g.260973 Transcript_85346/m.260973 type:complete len:314 (+) Transcript_85346:995-1936(+)
MSIRPSGSTAAVALTRGPGSGGHCTHCPCQWSNISTLSNAGDFWFLPPNTYSMCGSGSSKRRKGAMRFATRAGTLLGANVSPPSASPSPLRPRRLSSKTSSVNALHAFGSAHMSGFRKTAAGAVLLRDVRRRMIGCSSGSSSSCSSWARARLKAAIGFAHVAQRRPLRRNRRLLVALTGLPGLLPAVPRDSLGDEPAKDCGVLAAEDCAEDTDLDEGRVSISAERSAASAAIWITLGSSVTVLCRRSRRRGATSSVACSADGSRSRGDVPAPVCTPRRKQEGKRPAMASRCCRRPAKLLARPPEFALASKPLS